MRKTPFQFWREIWFQVIVILLQLYVEKTQYDFDDIYLDIDKYAYGLRAPLKPPFYIVILGIVLFFNLFPFIYFPCFFFIWTVISLFYLDFFFIFFFIFWKKSPNRKGKLKSEFAEPLFWTPFLEKWLQIKKPNVWKICFYLLLIWRIQAKQF